MTPDRAAAERVADAAMVHAESLGVSLIVEWEEEAHRLTFHIDRGSAPKGSGGRAITRLVELADDAGIDVTLNVVNSEPDLVRHYWRFGFRLCSEDPDEETGELKLLEAERSAFLSKPGNEPVDFGVTFMWAIRIPTWNKSASALCCIRSRSGCSRDPQPCDR